MLNLSRAASFLTAALLITCVTISTLWVRNWSTTEAVTHTSFRQTGGATCLTMWVFGFSAAGEMGICREQDTSGGMADTVAVSMAALFHDGWHHDRDSGKGWSSFDAGRAGDLFRAGRLCISAGDQTNAGGFSSGVGVVVPTWIAMFGTGFLPVLSVVCRIRRSIRRVPGRCRRCGYDLRASPERCPECGAGGGASAGGAG